jgi:hypothetical protein
MLKRFIILLLRLVLISLPRVLLACALYGLSIVSRQVGRVGSFVLFRGIPYLPVRLMISPESAWILRDDFMTVMDGAADALIEQHFAEGHTRELASRNLRDGLERGEFVQPEKYDVGEFGVSLLLTFSALGLVYFRLPVGLAEALSLWIAAITLVLLLAISTRTLLIDLLAYEEPTNGSLTENTKRLAWNGSFLSDLYPLTTLLVLKSTRATGDDMYRLTAYSFGVGLEQAIKNDASMMLVFTEVFLDGCKRIVYGEDLPEDVPPAEEFRYLNQ